MKTSIATSKIEIDKAQVLVVLPNKGDSIQVPLTIKNKTVKSVSCGLRIIEGGRIVEGFNPLLDTDYQVNINVKEIDVQPNENATFLVNCVRIGSKAKEETWVEIQEQQTGLINEAIVVRVLLACD